MLPFKWPDHHHLENKIQDLDNSSNPIKIAAAEKYITIKKF
jgi:hypothetical protein